MRCWGHELAHSLHGQVQVAAVRCFFYVLALGFQHEQPGSLIISSPSFSVPAQVDGDADSEEEEEGMGNVDVESGPITVDV